MAEEEFLVPLDQYLKAGLHIGTKYKTKYMEPFIYKVRSDGLSILNIQEINKRLKILAGFLARYNPEEILVIGRRENSWKALRSFSQVTGIKIFTERYSPGVLLNPALEEFMEINLLLVVDPFPDKNVIDDALKLGVPVIALCDTNNTANELDLVVPCNNKGRKSLGLIFYILAREYLKLRKLGDLKLKPEDFGTEDE
ncbi:30S ribosomal protein S2 [Candidatus Woesearchaeota archaeon]|nr:30S ribosomal protein S2 [Candidatus Woesearchaeota archaeon]